MSHNEDVRTISISNGTIIRVILFGLLVAGLFVLRDLILVLLTSIVIASFVTKLASTLKKYKIPRTLSVVFLYFITLATFTSLLYVFLPILITEIVHLVEYVPALSLISPETFSSLRELAQTFAGGFSASTFLAGTQLISSVSAGFLGTLSFAFGSLINFVLIIIISFYLSIQEKGIESFLRIITPRKYEEYVISLWARSERKIALWIQGQFLLGLLVGVLIYLGLSILGMQYALLIAVVAAICELIPFGLILAAIPALSFAFAEGGITLSILVGGFYIIVQQFESYLIAPLIVNKIIGVSPLVVILAILIGSTLAGFWGIILAIPVAVVFLELFDDIEKKKQLLPK
jgi:predicted PurR-regulated permease PerM